MKRKLKVLDTTNSMYADMVKVLLELIAGKFTSKVINAIDIEGAKPVLASKYTIYSETMEAKQVEEAKELINYK